MGKVSIWKLLDLTLNLAGKGKKMKEKSWEEDRRRDT